MHRGCHFLWERLRPEYFEGQKFQEHGMHDQGYNDFEDHGNTDVLASARDVVEQTV